MQMLKWLKRFKNGSKCIWCTLIEIENAFLGGAKLKNNFLLFDKKRRRTKQLNLSKEFYERKTNGNTLKMFTTIVLR